jgi:hypothetical protein
MCYFGTKSIRYEIDSSHAFVHSRSLDRLSEGEKRRVRRHVILAARFPLPAGEAIEKASSERYD